jgi:hypothetical protein
VERIGKIRGKLFHARKIIAQSTQSTLGLFTHPQMIEALLRRYGELIPETRDRKLLMSQIEAKFGSHPAEVRARVEAATQAQLTELAKRILTAASIDELFPA